MRLRLGHALAGHQQRFCAGNGFTLGFAAGRDACIIARKRALYGAGKRDRVQRRGELQKWRFAAGGQLRGVSDRDDDALARKRFGYLARRHIGQARAADDHATAHRFDRANRLRARMASKARRKPARFQRAAKRLPAGFAGKSYCDANHAASSFADENPKNDWRSIIRADKFCQGGWISTSFFPYT